MATTPRTLPIPEGYSLLPAGTLLEEGDMVYGRVTKRFHPTEMIGFRAASDLCYIRPRKLRTACCNYAAASNNYPVYYNPGNNVVQCHNCGHIYVPVNVKLQPNGMEQLTQNS